MSLFATKPIETIIAEADNCGRRTGGFDRPDAHVFRQPPVYSGLGYVTQRRLWTVGLIASIINIAIWSSIGLAWWKILGWW